MLINDYPQKTTLDSTDYLLISESSGVYKKMLASVLSPSSVVYPETFTHFHDESIVISGNPITAAVSSSYFYNMICYQNPPALNDSFQFKRLLVAGTYKFNILGTTGNVYGKISIYLNSSKLTEVDMYTASNTLNSVKSVNITIPTSGMQTFLLKVESKNASSGNYFASLQKLWGYKL